MIATSATRADVVALSETAAFNRWAGFEVVDAGDGRAELKLPWRADLGQYAGFLHASMIGGMIDTACGFAAFTLSGRVLASHISVNCLAPATGDAFVARARVVKAGRRQVFARAELFALRGEAEHLVATGDVILVPSPPMAALSTPPAREAARTHPFDEATALTGERDVRRAGPAVDACATIEGSSRRGVGADEGTMPGPQARRRGRNPPVRRTAMTRRLGP